MSDDAKTLMHFINHWREGCADDSAREYCAARAFVWAAHIIAT